MDWILKQQLFVLAEAQSFFSQTHFLFLDRIDSISLISIIMYVLFNVCSV